MSPKSAHQGGENGPIPLSFHKGVVRRAPKLLALFERESVPQAPPAF